MAISNTSQKIFTVWFNELERWDCSFFRKICWNWPQKFIVPLSNILTRKQDQVSDLENVIMLPIIEKITFGGIISITDAGKRKNYKGRLFWAERGDLIYSKIRVKQGSFAVVPNEISRLAVSAEYPVYIVNHAICEPAYLTLVLRSKAFLNLLEGLSHGGSTKTRIPPAVFERLEVPVPPLPVQQSIVELWTKTQEEIESMRAKIETIEKDLSSNALGKAGIELFPLRKRTVSFSIDWKDIERWGVEFNRWEWKISELLLSSKYPMVVLSDEAFINPTDNYSLTDDKLVSFIPMEAVSDKTGELVTPQTRKYREVKNGYSRFRDNDVIWAKITPCMQNGKCAVVRNMENGIGIGSTEFHVIRTKNIDRLIPDYIWILLRLDHLRHTAQRYFIGSAGQQRVPYEFLSNLYIPLPPVEIQKTIIRDVIEAQSDIMSMRTAATSKALEIKSYIEDLILGKKKIENI
ncbi:MAG TPA: restriction endonuclease subunit S [Dissulfurispiraceae bacterium]|nr:restriction endonuclease subunit S [Dissulfurispiraceae bacterium]